MEKQKWIALTGLWTNETSRGGRYLSGKLGLGAKVMVWPVSQKSPKHPTHMLYVLDDSKDERPKQDEQQPETDAPF